MGAIELGSSQPNEPTPLNVVILPDSTPSPPELNTGDAPTDTRGTITIEATGGIPPYTYSIDGVNYQSSNVFTNVDRNNVTVYIKDNVGTIVTIEGIDSLGVVQYVEGVTAIPIPTSLPSDPIVLTEPSSESGGTPITIPDSLPSDSTILTEPANESGGSPINVPDELPSDPIVLTDITVAEDGSPVTIPSVLPTDPVVLIDGVSMSTPVTEGFTIGAAQRIPFVNSSGDDFTYDSNLSYVAGTDTLNVFNILLGGVATLNSLLMGGVTVDTIETTLTNDNTHIPTSGAVFDAIGVLAHGNHTGQIISTGLATSLHISAITGQSELSVGLLSTDELLVNDGGSLARMDISVLETYMQDNLTFSSYTHPNHTGQVLSTGDGATALDITSITAQTELTSGLVSGDELLVNDNGVLSRMDISVLAAHMNANLNFNLYVHPNHYGHVSSNADGVQTLLVAAITGQTELTTGLVSTDELLVNDGGVIKRMDMSVAQTYMQDNLAFNLYVHPNHTGQVESVADGAQSLTVTAITAQTELTGGLLSTDEFLVNDGGVISRLDTSVLQAYMEDSISYLAGVNYARFNTGYTPGAEIEGLVWWNSNDHTLNLATGLGPVIQVGQEFLYLVYNNTAGTLLNGKVVRAVGPSTGGFPWIEYAKADVWETIFGGLGILTQDIDPGEYGYATTNGKVRGLNTGSLSLGYFYISDTIAGDLTNIPPEFPSYAINMGGVTKTGVTDGEYTILQTTRVNDTHINFWNGTFRESFAFTVSEAGGVVTGTLVPTNGNVDMTALFSTGMTTIITDPPATIVLTPGTDTVPQMNYVYVPESTKVLTVSTSEFPTNIEHIRVASVLLRSAATTGVDDALRNQNWNDHIQGTDGQGHLTHITQKLRKFEAQWESGCELSAVHRAAPNPDELYVTITGGSIFQLHPQSFKAFDTEATDDIHVWNHPTTPYIEIQDLATQTQTSLGASLANRHYSVVIWGAVTSAGEPDHIFVNLPTGSYSSAADALSDPDNHAIYTIPNDFAGVGFLIGRLILQFGAGTGTIAVTATEDLRGKLPNTSAGGGSIGGAGATTFLALTDVPSTYASQALYLPRVNAGETALEFWNLNTWIGSAAITTLGTIGTGIWQGGVIADAYIANDITLTDITQITNRSHTNLTNIGSNTHAQIDTHVGDSTLHFLEGSIDHTAITNIGTNTHAQIDTHIGVALVDADFASAGLMASNGAGVYSIVVDNSANWNTAFGWGDHSGLYSLLAHTHLIADITDFTDNSTNWNTAYGWGDHAGLYDPSGTMTTHEATYNHANYDTAYGWGDHSGLYAALSHAHGNITNAGAIGSTTNLPIITTTSGVLIASSFGTGANTFCEGNDARLSDARTPLSHTLLSHTISGETIGHVLAADSATTYSIRALLFSELSTTPTTLSGYGISDTKANFDTALSDGDFMYVGDAPTSHTLLSHTISGETSGHVLVADSATTYSIRQLLGSEINNDLGWDAVTPSALTRTNDTNVTLTLGGTPTTALLEAVSLTLGWTGTLADGRIASASTWNAKQDAITDGSGLTFTGATLDLDIDSLATETTIAAGDFVPFWDITVTATNKKITFANLQTALGIPTVTPAALTRTNDTNVTLTLGGTPSTALLQATSITVGWTGTLADGRIASATNWNTAYTHSQIVTGNPHDVDWSELTGSQPAPISHTLLSHSISGETTGHVLAADTATTYSIRQLLGSEISNTEGWTSNAGTVTSVSGGTGIASTGGATPSLSLTVDELSEKTGAVVGTDRLVGTTSTTNWAETISGIPLSIFNSDLGYADISDFATGVSTNETSHTDVVVDGDFSANGILRRTAAGVYASLTGSATVDTIETTLTDDDTHLPTSGAVTDAIAGIASWGTASNEYIVFGSTGGDIQSSSLFFYDTTNRIMTVQWSSNDFATYGYDRWSFNDVVSGGYWRFVQVSANVVRFDQDDNSGYTSFSSPMHFDASSSYFRTGWNFVLDQDKIIYLDGATGDSRIYDTAGDLIFRDENNTGGITLSSLVAGGGGGEWTADTNGITYTAGNVGIGVASDATIDLLVGSNGISTPGSIKATGSGTIYVDNGSYYSRLHAETFEFTRNTSNYFKAATAGGTISFITNGLSNSTGNALIYLSTDTATLRHGAATPATKLYTDASGVQVTGRMGVGVSSDSQLNAIYASNTSTGTSAATAIFLNASGNNCALVAYGDNHSTFGPNHSRIQSTAGGCNIGIGSTSETGLLWTLDGAVDLYHNNIAKFSTSSGGAVIYGSSVSTLTISGTTTGGAWGAGLILNSTANNRGRGVFYTHDADSTEWFSGIAYNSGNDYVIGYDASGGQAEYIANSIVRVTPAGYVGIGTDPSYKLDVSGTLGCSSNFVAGGTITGSIATSFSGTYPIVVQVTGLLYSHSALTYTGSSALLHNKAADTVTGVIRVEGGKNTVTAIGEINAALEFGSNDASVQSTGRVGAKIVAVTEATNGANNGMGFYTYQQTGDLLTEKFRITYNGVVGPKGQFELGSSQGNNILQWSNDYDTLSNHMYHRVWSLRNAAGSDWNSASLHDAISIDNSFGTPGTDTKCFWERDPQAGIHYWGNTATTFFKADSGGITTAYDLHLTGSSRGVLFGTGTTKGLEMSYDGTYFNVGIGPYSTAAAFYINSSIPITYIYSPSIYLGPGTTATTVLFRDSYLTGSEFKIWGQGGDASFGATTAVTSGYKLELFGTGNKGRAADWTATSDRRLKHTVNPYENVLEKIMMTRGMLSTYIRNEDKTNTIEIGYIAQDMLSIFPEVVGGSEKEMYDVSYMRLGAIALEGVALVKTEVDAMKERIVELESQVNNLKNRKYGSNNN